MSNRALPQWHFEWDGDTYAVASRDPRAVAHGPFRCRDAGEGEDAA